MQTLVLAALFLSATSYAQVFEITLGGLFPLNTLAGVEQKTAMELATLALYARSTRDILSLDLFRTRAKFKLVIADTQGTQKDTLEQSLNLIRESGAQVVIGPATSENAELASLVAGLNDVPVISYGATAAFLSDKAEHPFFFRTVPSDFSQSTVLVETLTEFNIKNCAIIHSNGPYGFGLVSLIKQIVSELPAEEQIAFSETVIVPEGAERGSERILSAVRSLVPVFENDPTLGAILLLVQNPADGIAVLEAAIQAGLAGNPEKPYIWIGSNGVAQITKENAKELSQPDAVVGMIATTPARAREGALFDAVYLDEWEQERAETMDRVRVGNNTVTSLREINSESVLAAYAYDAVLVVANAIEFALADNVPVEELTGRKLSEYFQQVSFTGATGNVGFDQSQDRPALYDVINANTDPNMLSANDLWQVIGSYEQFNRVFMRNFATPVWAGGVDEKPIFTRAPLPPPEPEPVPAGFVAAIVIVAMLVLACCVVLLARVYARRKQLREAERIRALNMPPTRWSDDEVVELIADQEEMASGVFDMRSNDDVAVHFGPDGSDELPWFGLDKLARMPVMKLMADKLVLFNRTAQTVEYEISLPDGEHAFEIDARPGVGVVKGRQEKYIHLTVKLLHTYKLNAYVRVRLKGQGDVVVPLRFEGELSLRLDPDELELLGKPIGGGAFGTVYRGRYRGTTVAAKVLRRQNQQDEKQEIAFKQEIALAERLRNPYIVNFIGASHVPGKLCMCTELLERGSVLELIAKVRVPLPLKVKLLTDACRAIAFLHENGVLYRDLKPDNLLVFSTSLNSVVNCKLSDFGTARIVDDVEIDGDYTTAIGTPIYMAPEMMDGHMYCSKVDVYASAMLMWELMAEKQPFHNVKRVWDLPRIVVEGVRPSLDPSWPEEIRDLIVSCWMHNPDNRPFMVDVVDDLSDLFDNLLIESGKNKKGGKASKPKKKASKSSKSSSNESLSTKTAKKAKFQVSGGDSADGEESRRRTGSL